MAVIKKQQDQKERAKARPGSSPAVKQGSPMIKSQTQPNSQTDSGVSRLANTDGEISQNGVKEEKGKTRLVVFETRIELTVLFV